MRPDNEPTKPQDQEKAIKVERMGLTDAQIKMLTVPFLTEMPDPQENSPQESQGLFELPSAKPRAETVIEVAEALRAHCSPETAAAINQALLMILKDMESD